MYDKINYEFECACGLRLERPIYPVYCRCGKVYSSDSEHVDYMTTCPHLQDDVCEIATEVSGVTCKVTQDTCRACSHGIRPQRLNTVTLTIAYSQNPKIDTTYIQSIIDGEEVGFGTRLSRLFGLILIETPNCGCKGHADILDVWTPSHIKENMDKVIDWLQNEARLRKIPFSRALTRTLLHTLLQGSPCTPS